MISPSYQPWDALPAEMKLAIMDLLDLPDVKSLAKVNRQAYLLSVPTLFRVSMDSLTVPFYTQSDLLICGAVCGFEKL